MISLLKSYSKSFKYVFEQFEISMQEMQNQSEINTFQCTVNWARFLKINYLTRAWLFSSSVNKIGWFLICAMQKFYPCNYYRSFSKQDVKFKNAEFSFHNFFIFIYLSRHAFSSHILKCNTQIVVLVHVLNNHNTTKYVTIAKCSLIFHFQNSAHLSTFCYRKKMVQKYDHPKYVSRLCMNYLAGVQRWRKVYCARYFILRNAQIANIK